MAPAASKEEHMRDNPASFTLGKSIDLAEMERQAQEFEDKAAQLVHKAQAIRQIIGGFQALNGSAGEVLMRSFSSHKTAFEIRPSTTNGPRGPKAVLAIMREQPERVWKVVDLKREMLRRGWAPTPKAVEGSVKRLRGSGELIPAGYGFYKLPPLAAATDEREAA
jgi:hypothetical protein